MVSDSGRALDRESANHLDWLLIALGALLILGGVLALASSVYATLSTVMVTGGVLLGAGVVVLVEALSRRRLRSPWFGVAIGLLYLVVGGLLVARPLGGALAITALLAALFFLGGALRVIAALSLRLGAWGWRLLSGLVSIALGFYVIAQWPLSALWLVGTLVGIELLFVGTELVALGASVHRIERWRERRPRAPMQPAH